MKAHLEVHKPEGIELIVLGRERFSIGKEACNDLGLVSDARVSRMHALLERVGSGWLIRDLGSRNGTFVNGERIMRERPLQGGDEIRIGQTIVFFRDREHAGRSPSTETALKPPDVTRREQDVLIALCRPLMSGDVFTEPASIRSIAAELVISEAAVKQHVIRLYDKFGLYDQEERRRVRLANEAISRGVVRLADLRAGKDRPGRA